MLWMIYPLGIVLIFTAVAYGDSPIKGSMQAHALVQAWTFNDTSLPSAWFNFRVRRAQLLLRGDFSDQARWFISIDPANRLKISSAGTLSAANDNSILEEAGAAITLFDGVEVVAGQINLPLIAEGNAPDGVLLLPERSIVSRILGDKKEPGLMLSGKWGGFQSQLMGSSGNGPNRDDNNNSKDLTLRLSYEFEKGSELGVFGSLKNMSFYQCSFGGIDYNLKRGPWAFRVEGGMNRTLGVTGYGAVTELGFMLTEKLQPVARLDLYNPNSVQSSFAESESLGLNYYVSGKGVKVQASASSIRGMQGNGGTPEVAIGKPRATLLMLSFSIQR